MVVCVLLPRFALTVAARGRAALAAGPLALAPEAGRAQLLGEASAAAEAHGVHAGLRLGEALARCPTLRLVAPDPMGVADAWEEVLAALEGIGAGVESGPAGVAWFAEQGLRTLHGGTLEDVLAAARRALATVAAPARLGAAPTRFAALAAATRARPGRTRRARSEPTPAEPARRARSEVAPTEPAPLAAYLASLPLTLLRTRPETAHLPEDLERFGVETLGELAALPRGAVADRFGPAGILARDLARGSDTPLVPRSPAERLEEELELPEAASGPQLERALELLVDRVLARRERRGRTLRAVVLAAVLVEGGTWRIQVTFREALLDPRRMRLALAHRLAELPAPAAALRLRVEAFGPPAADQRSLLAEAASVRSARLREAVRQARAVAGPDAALRIIAVDPDSRVPERRLALAPWDP